MFAVASRNTERGIRARNFALEEAARQERIRIQRELWEKRIAEANRLAENRRIAAEKAEAMVRELRAAGIPFRHTYREIERRACDLFGLLPSELRSNRRNREVVFARQFVMYWAARLTRLSLPQIGRLMGGRDHTTILHGKRVYTDKRAAMGRHLRVVR